MIAEPVEVKALDKYNIFLRFSDGKEGIIDLSELKGKGVFKAWDDSSFFQKVFIDKETKAIAWDENLELDVNNLYLKVIGKSFDEWKNENLEYAANK